MGQKRIDQMSSAEFDAAFPDDAACSAYLLAHRWPDGVRCPHCGTTEVRRHNDGPHWRWECLRCAGDTPRSFRLRTGTIFENTHLSLRTWLGAVHLLAIGRRALGPAEIQRLLGLNSYQTAWHVCRVVRDALADPEFRVMIGLPEHAPVDEGAAHVAPAVLPMDWERPGTGGPSARGEKEYRAPAE